MAAVAWSLDCWPVALLRMLAQMPHCVPMERRKRGHMIHKHGTEAYRLCPNLEAV